jgi:hypothetical protein
VLRVLAETCAATETLASVRAELALATSTEDEAASTAELASTADLEPALCPDGRCSTVRRGIQLYRDDDHLSIDGARELTPVFATLIREHVRVS